MYSNLNQTIRDSVYREPNDSFDAIPEVMREYRSISGDRFTPIYHYASVTTIQAYAFNRKLKGIVSPQFLTKDGMADYDASDFIAKI